MPGPKEQTADEIQQYFRPIISDLLQLWREGIRIPMSSCPSGIVFPIAAFIFTNITTGHLIHVILIAIVCNKPAAHKIAGFASHSHTYFCTDCWIGIQDKSTQAAFQLEGKRSSHPHLMYI